MQSANVTVLVFCYIINYTRLKCQQSQYSYNKFQLSSFKMSHNDLQASDGRDTEALNCKPITNL
jgi:hypothetical protein